MRPTHCGPYRIEFREAPVRRRLVPNPPPDPLLRIQGGLVAWEVVEVEARVGPEEAVHGLAFMPPGAIDVQPNREAPQPPAEVAEGLQEARPVPPRQPEHATPAEAGRHPTAEVEPGVVLAGRGDPEAFAALAPAAAQAGMEREAGLIGEDDGLLRAEGLEFFLAGAGTRAPRCGGPGDNCNWLASAGSPVGGARAGLGAP